MSSRLSSAVSDAVGTAVGTVHRSDPSTRRTGGPAGNARLTAWSGLLLLVIFGVECITLISLDSLLVVHIAVGAFLIPLVLLKTGTTGWRIARYYLGSPTYRRAGPPPLVLRVLGPLVVLTGLAVLGSGLALIAVGSATFTPLFIVVGFRVNALTIHQAAFAAWLAATGLHVLLRTTTAVKLTGGSDARHQRVPGAAARLTTLLVTLAIGAATSALVLHLSSAWTTGDLQGHDGPRNEASVPRTGASVRSLSYRGPLIVLRVEDPPQWLGRASD